MLSCQPLSILVDSMPVTSQGSSPYLTAPLRALGGLDLEGTSISDAPRATGCRKALPRSRMFRRLADLLTCPLGLRFQGSLHHSTYALLDRGARLGVGKFVGSAPAIGYGAAHWTVVLATWVSAINAALTRGVRRLGSARRSHPQRSQS